MVRSGRETQCSVWHRPFAGLLLVLAWQSSEVSATRFIVPLLGTSAVMLAVGLLACIEPARRALRIQPIEALKTS